MSSLLPYRALVTGATHNEPFQPLRGSKRHEVYTFLKEGILSLSKMSVTARSAPTLLQHTSLTYNHLTYPSIPAWAPNPDIRRITMQKKKIYQFERVCPFRPKDSQGMGPKCFV